MVEQLREGITAAPSPVYLEARMPQQIANALERGGVIVDDEQSMSLVPFHWPLQSTKRGIDVHKFCTEIRASFAPHPAPTTREQKRVGRTIFEQQT